MPSRHRSRQRALQILYLWDLRRQPADEAIRNYHAALYPEDAPAESRRDDFLEELVHGAVAHVADIDERISRHAEHWRIERMPTVDRNILRLAVYEMVHTDTPAAVAIDEALELARRFSGEESVQFVNGVLDAVHKEIGPVPESGPAGA